MARDLSPAKCVLLTIHYASEGNVKALRSFHPLRPDALSPKLILRILLTYLPESIEPREYTTYISEVCSQKDEDLKAEYAEVDITPVADVDERRARRRVKGLKLIDIRPPSFDSNAAQDIITQFLCQRAYRIDAETGLLNLIPQLVEPFLENNEYLRTWYFNGVLPLVRLQFEYYPQDENQMMNLVEFEKLDGMEGVDFLMHNASTVGATGKSEVVRDIKGLVGPWMYGHTTGKRRKLEHPNSHANQDENFMDSGLQTADMAAASDQYKTDHNWSDLFRWMVSESHQNFPLVTEAVERWDGPGDVDLGVVSAGHGDLDLDKDTSHKLETEYAQAAIASCYAVESDTQETIYDAHRIVARLSGLLAFPPPPDLATAVDDLPQMERPAIHFDESRDKLDLEVEALLDPENPLTMPRLESYNLLQKMVYSAYQFSILHFPIPIIDLAKLYFNPSAEEQLAVLQRIVRALANDGARRDEELWIADLSKLRWLWSWGFEDDLRKVTSGAGVLGRISSETFEEEMLKCLIETNCYDLAINLYLKSSDERLPHRRVEQIVLIKAMEAYDSASNGNRTRGGIKKAFDVLSAFRPFFPQSVALRQAVSLISATHALSFYSLTLQHGVPFQPVTIRVSHDPISLISKVLEQNPGSYTQLDDLVNIARNLVSAGLPQRDLSAGISQDEGELESKRTNAERRVTLMAVEAALHEDDFETAYSYIVSRLTPSSADIKAPKDTRHKSRQHNRNISNTSTQSGVGELDDISWRAPFLAGRYRPSTASPPSLRRLEQRTELLSLALLLAPVSALSEILAAWRRCEEETTALQLSQQQAEEEIDDRADKRESTASIPGNFVVQGEQPALVYNQKRREMGRISGKTGGDNDAPMSMFDLTRSAAQTLSKNAFPLRGLSRPSSSYDTSSAQESEERIESQQRARKRDLVANAVSGGLASGIGWVIGLPANYQPPRTDDQ